MANLSDIYLRTSINGSTITIYLSGVKTPWTGTGTPWTLKATTPFEIGMNQRTGEPWTPRVATPSLLLSGGELPRVIDRSAAPITETIPIQLYADTYDHTVYLKNLLQRVLVNQTYDAPVTLWVLPYGASKVVVYEILDGSIQENAAFINDEAGRNFMRATMTITRQAWGVAASAVNALSTGTATMSNTPLGTPDNSVQIDGSTIDGEYAYTGQPMNIQLVPLTTSTVSRLWLATVADTEDPASSDTTSYSTTSTAGVTKREITVHMNLGMDKPVKPRAMVRVSSVSGAAEFRVVVYTGASVASAQTILYTSPWQAAPASAAMLDCGTWPMDLYKRARTPLPFATCAIQLRSTTGASVSAQINWLQVLWYYEFCRIDAALSVDFYLRIDQYTDGVSFHPRLVPPTASIYDRSNQTPVGFADVRGTLPRYHTLPSSDGGIWINWLNSSSAHVTSEQVTIAPTFLPLFGGLRGAL